MANLKDTIVLGNLTVTGTITGRTINPNDYYWANMNISTSSNTATTPTFASISLAGANGTGALTRGSVNYGSLAVTGDNNGYAGINIGNSNNRMTIMDSGSHAGLYSESGGGWYLCYDRDSSTLGIGHYGAPASNNQGYKINLHSNTQVVGKIFADQFRGNSTSVSWYQGRDSAVFRNIAVSGYHALWSLKTTNGSWDFGEYSNGSDNNVPILTYIQDTHYNSNSNTATHQIKFPLASGTVALTNQIKNPTDYYWANVKVSSTSSTSTTPTFAEVNSEYGHFEWSTVSNALYSNNLLMYDASSTMYIGDSTYNDNTPSDIEITAHDRILLNINGSTIAIPPKDGIVALLNDYWADVKLSNESNNMTTPQFLRAKIGNAKRAVTCDPRTTVTSTGDTILVNNLPTGSTHLGLLTWDAESGFLGVDGDNAIICTPGDKGIFNAAGYLFILDEDNAFSTSSYKAYVDSSGAWKTNSDIRLKTNIKNYPSVLEGIKQLDIITYTYIDQAQEKRSMAEARLAEAQNILQRPLLSAKQAAEAQETIQECNRMLRRLNEKRNKIEIGLSAQQIEEKLPIPELFISKNPDEQLGYKYTLSEAKLVFAAIKAIQEQQTIIENQQKLIDNLTQEVATIKAIIERGDDNE